MARRYLAGEVVERLRRELEAGRPLFVPNCGSGLTARLQEQGGADLICVSATSWWRLRGQGSLAALVPSSDVNAIVLELAPEVLANVKETPVLSLAGAFDPLLPHDVHLDRLRELGFSGVNPLPVGLYGEELGAQLDAIGIGWGREAELVAEAARREMFALAYAFTPEQARVLAEVGAHAIASHVGTTVGGLRGAVSRLTLEEAAARSEEIFTAAREAAPDVLLLAHGGPIEGPDEVAYVLERTSAQGFIGGSAAERVPIERAVVAATREFKSLSPGRPPGPAAEAS